MDDEPLPADIAPSATARARWRLMIALLRQRVCFDPAAPGRPFVGGDRGLDLERRQRAAFADDAALRQAELHQAIDVLLDKHARRRP